MSRSRWQALATAGFLFATITAFLIVPPGPTVAQYGGGSHTHNWSAEPLLVKPTVLVNPKYWRVGPVILLNVTPATVNDYDTCQTLNPPCPFPGRIAGNVVQKTQWSDGGAGGQFGKLVNGQFETCPENDVTHYKASDTPQVVTITMTWDDVATATEPNTEPPQTINTADDPAKTSDPEKFTVWDFTIEGPPSAWRPQGGPGINQTTLTMEIQPPTDHQPASMAANIEVTLGTSHVPGWCINRQYEGADAVWETIRDLYFPSPQTDWTIGFDAGGNAGQRAFTQSPVLMKQITVQSLDYGGWSVATALILGEHPIGGKRARDKRKPASGPGYREYCNLPYDDDGDHIPDSLDRSQAEDGHAGPNNVRDPEVLREGNDNRGDGFSDYQEYRGLIRNGAWQMLDKTKAEVLIEDPDNLGFGNFALTGLTPLAILDTECSAGGVVDWSSLAVQQVVTGGQRRIYLRNRGGAGAREDPFGRTTPGPGIPSTIIECSIYPENINAWVEFWFPQQDWPTMKARELTHTITHELSHAVNMAHHNNNPLGGPFDILRYATPASLQQNLHNFYCTGAGDPREVLLQMRLRN